MVLIKIVEIALTSAADPKASCEPPLKPNQPNQRIKVPSVAKGIEEPSIGITFPFLSYFPVLAPRNIAPVKAAHPPTE